MSINNRKPVHLEYSSGKSPRQQIWEKIRWLKKFELINLVNELPGTIDRSTTRTYVKSLVKSGHLEPYSGDTYRLVVDNGVEAPRINKKGELVSQGLGQENMWRTLRNIGGALSYRELSALASTETTQINPESARDYLGNLKQAGYLTTDERGKFRLLAAMNTGPRPPMVQRIRQIFDPNLGKVMWRSEGALDD